MHNTINWFELPAKDFERAVTFYQTILGKPLRRDGSPERPTAIFPYADPGVGGSIVKSSNFEPSNQGALVYFATGGDLDSVLRRVEAAGGKVVLPTQSIGDPGFVALIIDTEGNKVGLHAPNP